MIPAVYKESILNVPSLYLEQEVNPVENRGLGKTHPQQCGKV
jgi:hypothetical protein